VAVAMAGLGLITDSGVGFTVTNVNDKIVGAGALGAEFGLCKQSGDRGDRRQRHGNDCDSHQRRAD
jgi:hypothetical protein